MAGPRKLFVRAPPASALGGDEIHPGRRDLEAATISGCPTPQKVPSQPDSGVPPRPCAGKRLKGTLKGSNERKFLERCLQLFASSRHCALARRKPVAPSHQI